MNHIYRIYIYIYIYIYKYYERKKGRNYISLYIYFPYIYIYLYTINWHNIRVVKSSKNSLCRFMLQKTKKINCTTAAGLGHLVRMLT